MIPPFGVPARVLLQFLPRLLEIGELDEPVSGSFEGIVDSISFGGEAGVGSPVAGCFGGERFPLRFERRLGGGRSGRARGRARGE